MCRNLGKLSPEVRRDPRMCSPIVTQPPVSRGDARADSGSGSICLDEFGEYLGGLLPVMDLTGSVVDLGSHHRQVFRVGGDRDAFGEVFAQDPVRVLVAAPLPG